MTEKITIDVASKRIIVNNGITELDAEADIYSACKRLWKSDSSLNKIRFPFRTIGGDELPGSREVGAYFFLQNQTGYDWRIRPYEGDHELIIDGNLYPEDSTSAMFVATLGGYSVSIYLERSSLTTAVILEEEDIQHSSFEGGVWIDVINGTSGTEFPIGTQRSPVDNITDAQSIAVTRGFSKLYIIGDVTFGATDNIDGYIIKGQNVILSTVTITSGCSTVGTEFDECTLVGTLSGAIIVKHSMIGALNGFYGSMNNCCLTDTIKLNGTSSDLAQFIDCHLGTQEVGVITIDMDNDGPSLSMRSYVGGVKIINKTGNSKAIIDFVSGRIELDSTITNGTFFIRGVGEITSNNATGITLNTDGLLQGKELRSIYRTETGRWKITNNQLIIYDEDGVTPLKTFNLLNKEGQPSESNVFERTPT